MICFVMIFGLDQAHMGSPGGFFFVKGPMVALSSLVEGPALLLKSAYLSGARHLQLCKTNVFQGTEKCLAQKEYIPHWRSISMIEEGEWKEGTES